MKRRFYYWFLLLAVCLFVQCQQAPETKTAKYVFYFIGDGMGVNHVNGTEMFLAEQEGRIGVKPLNFTQFPVENLMTTYSRYNAITCSSAAGTAMACGEKTRNGILGMDSLHQEPLYSVAVKAKAAGRRVGIMTTVSIDHATPGAFYAHQPDREMYYEIAMDMAKTGFDLYAGAGFLEPESTRQPGASSRQGGTAARQCSSACGQRGWKRQPGGGASGLGSSPATGAGRRRRAAGSADSRGEAASRACV